MGRELVHQKIIGGSQRGGKRKDRGVFKILPPWKKKKKKRVRKMMAPYQTVSTPNMLDTTRYGLGRVGAGLAEAE